MIRLARVMLAMAGSLMLASVAAAADFPTRTVQVIVPYAPACGVDLTSRLMTQMLAEQTKGNFIVENKPGASGLLGASTVANATPDGYTWLVAADTMTSVPYIVASMPINPQADIVPITQIALSPYIFVISPKIPANSVAELIKFAKDKPNDFKWAIGTVGSSAHLGIIRFNKEAKIDPLIVPYNGEASAVPALISGEVSGMLLSSGAAKPLIDAGSIKAIAVTTAQPFAIFPKIPTLASQGFPGFEAVSWYSVWGPKGMSADTMNMIQGLVVKAMTTQSVMDKVAGMGNGVVTSKSQAEFAKFVSDEFARNKREIEAIGIKPQ